jgi:hypothetical protein
MPSPQPPSARAHQEVCLYYPRFIRLIFPSSQKNLDRSWTALLVSEQPWKGALVSALLVSTSGFVILLYFIIAS